VVTIEKSERRTERKALWGSVLPRSRSEAERKAGGGRHRRVQPPTRCL
jgi:hypothetical protein